MIVFYATFTVNVRKHVPQQENVQMVWLHTHKRLRSTRFCAKHLFSHCHGLVRSRLEEKWFVFGSCLSRQGRHSGRNGSQLSGQEWVCGCSFTSGQMRSRQMDAGGAQLVSLFPLFVQFRTQASRGPSSFLPSSLDMPSHTHPQRGDTSTMPWPVLVNQTHNKG